MGIIRKVLIGVLVISLITFIALFGRGRVATRQRARPAPRATATTLSALQPASA